MFFPIAWMVLTSFKTEVEAVSTPPKLIFPPTIDNYITVQARADYIEFAFNSIVISVGATALALLIAIPAAYAMAFFPSKRTRGTLLWMLSTKMLPPVGVLVPIYLLFKQLNLIDSHLGLILVYALMNLPIIIWMLFTFFKEVPGWYSGGRPHRRRRQLGGNQAYSLAFSRARNRLDRPPLDHPLLERGFLVPQSDHQGRSPADLVHCQLLCPRRTVLGQALRRFDHGHRPDPGPRLAKPKTAGPRPHLRRRQVRL